MSNDAIEELQVKVAFLEEALSELSDEYYQQQKLLDKMAALIERLNNKLDERASEGLEASSDVDEKPPHY